MNGHASAGNGEANCQSHHELGEEIAQLQERERVLVSENGQLRGQLVEMKEEAHMKYDDLMVQYNMKREYEDDGTSNNQVTVKTEWDHEEVKVEVKEEIKENEEDHDIIIKREYVPAYIKTESNDVKVEIKEEIKEEEDNDEDSGWDRCLVKKELNTVDMIEIKEEVEDGEETRIIDMETLTQDRQVKREIEQEENEMTLHNDQIGHWVKREVKEEEEDGEDTDKLIITPTAANSPDEITHRTTELNSTRTELLVNLIEGGQNVDPEQSSLALADVMAHSQPSSIHHDNRQTEANSVPFDSSSNMSHSSDHHQPDNSQPNSVSLGSLTDQNATEMQQQIKQELSDEATTNNRNEQSNDDGDIVKDEYFSDCDVSDCVEPEIKGEFDYGQEVEIKQDEDEVEDDTTDNEEMVDIKEEEEEFSESQVDDFEGWTQDNQGGDESRSVENASMDTTATYPIGQSHNVQNASNENESIEEGCANLENEQLLNTAKQSDDPTGDLFSPSTSTGRRSNRTALNQQATASTGRNGTKRKQTTSNQTAKRSKKTVEVDDGEVGDDDGEDIINDGRDDAKVKVLYLNCTQSNCNVKLDSMVHLHDHLCTVHRLGPLRCFAQNCDARFDKTKLGDHIKLHHTQDTRFLCAICPKELDSQHKAYKHWYYNHLTGQFKCNLAGDCAQVSDTRGKMKTHQQTKHHSQLKLFPCTHPGCTVSFSCNSQLKRHELTHLASNQFHCNWPHCSKQFKLRANLVTHIRTQHFGLPRSMKEQKDKNIVDLRDPNEYVRVVVDE